MTGFAAIGLDHGHINGLVRECRDAGGVLAGYATYSDTLAEGFEAQHAPATRRSEDELLADPNVALIVSAAIPSERPDLAVRAMRAGKDVILDKPGVIDLDALETLRAVQAETGRRVRVHYSELESNAAARTARRLVREGAIGTVLHYNGTGPHRLDQGKPRPDWFWDKDRNGGILNDIASHQIAQFLVYSGADRASIRFARVASRGQHDGFEDMGDMVMEAGQAHGYGRVDWFTPPGMPVWGDGRIVLTGTKGMIEMRKYVDPAGEGPGAHLILTDDEGPRRIDCPDAPDFCANALSDAVEGTETAMAQATAFHLMELAVTAQRMAEEAQ